MSQPRKASIIIFLHPSLPSPYAGVNEPWLLDRPSATAVDSVTCKVNKFPPRMIEYSRFCTDWYIRVAAKVLEGTTCTCNGCDRTASNKSSLL